MPGVEALRGSGSGHAGPSPADVRARIYGAVARAADPERAEEKPVTVPPAPPDRLRARLEEVRAGLAALADVAATPPPPTPPRRWPPPDPRHAIPAPPPVPMTTVPADLLARVDSELATARALMSCIETALESQAGATGVAAASAPSPQRDQACMVALNMALNGASPMETSRYLAEHFDLPDADVIVGDAYAQRARMHMHGGNGHGPRRE